MPAVIIIPQTDGDSFGPGFRIDINTNGIGPWPVGSSFVASLFTTDASERQVSQETYVTQEQSVDTEYLTHPDQLGAQDFMTLQGTLLIGQELRLVVQHFSGSNLEGETSRLVKWEPTQGLTNIVQGLPAVTGGFTPADRTDLNATVDQTLVTLPVLGGLADFATALSDWTQLSHGTILSRGPVQLLSGRGSLELQVLAGRGIPFGATFSWFTVPSELGFTDGVVPHYTRSLFELSTIYADIGLDLYRQDLREFHEDGYFWDWLGKVPPERLDYWALPGIVVAFQFMYTKP